MSDISQSPKPGALQAPDSRPDLSRGATSIDLSTLSLQTGLTSFEAEERTPHSRESVEKRWRSNREFPDTGTRMIINAGGKPA